MPLKTRDLESKLVQKFGFSRAKSHSDDHRWYQLDIAGCPTIATMISHGKGEELRDKLEGKIARQLWVRVSFFREMINCTKSAEDYIRQVQTDPFPPFDVRF